MTGEGARGVCTHVEVHRHGCSKRAPDVEAQPQRWATHLHFSPVDGRPFDETRKGSSVTMDDDESASDKRERARVRRTKLERLGCGCRGCVATRVTAPDPYTVLPKKKVVTEIQDATEGKGCRRCAAPALTKISLSFPLSRAASMTELRVLLQYKYKYAPDERTFFFFFL